FSAKFQAAFISDTHYLEQHYNNEWQNELNQETFAYLKQQQNNWAWTLLAEPRLRQWITETAWLPKAEGYWLGQDFLDVFTHRAERRAGHAHHNSAHLSP